MAGTLIVSNLKTDTDNSFIVRSNTGTTLFVANTTGIDVANSFASSSITSDKILTIANTKISGNIISSQITSVANTQITGNIISSQITSVANTQISGNIISSQITSNPTLYGNVSVTGVIGVGGATPSTSGSGISFPATQSASSDANTLDDYEEGTWTPAFAFGGGTTGITYLGRGGYYTKVGRVVTLVGGITLTSKGSSTGTATITGLPFPAKSGPPYLDAGASGVISSSINLTTSTGIFLFLDHTSSSMDLKTGANASFTNSDFANNTTVYGISITYQTN